MTYNEELHIERCIKSLLPIVKQVFIVDSLSTDQTVEIAESLGAKVYQNTFVNQAVQFQWGLDHCPIETGWVMRMDADEYLEQPLIDEIIRRFPDLPDEVSGIALKRKHRFLGRWIRHGDRYPLILLRIWRTGQAHIEQRWMDEHIVLDSGKTLVFEENFVDDNLNNVEWFIEKHNRYASREMLDILNKKYRLFADDDSISESENDGQAKLKRFVKEKLYNRLPIFVRPTLYFIYRYFIRLGFLDGKEGFAYHFMQGFWYRCLVDLKCLEAERVLVGAESRKEKIARLARLTELKLK
ncbi:MAG: glycosyltransferase family 2 protein [Gammaproteobacteria bacterium]